MPTPPHYLPRHVSDIVYQFYELRLPLLRYADARLRCHFRCLCYATRARAFDAASGHAAITMLSLRRAAATPLRCRFRHADTITDHRYLRRHAGYLRHAD